MQKREQWGTRFGFIMAAVGSAIGLGNIWRFPYQAYENGGGAFLIPYFFAMLTAGIPLLILEFGLGHKMRGGAPSVFARITKKYSFMEKWEWLGWWQILIAFVISTYYVVVVGWTLSYIFISLKQGWGADPKAFFFGTYLNLPESGNPLDFNGIRWSILLSVSIVWLINWAVLYSGVKKGIEFANKIFMPTLIVLVLIIMFRCLFLDGAAEGLQWLFRPDFSKIWDVQVWANAYGQIFYSMSICFAIMITYSSYLPKKSDIVNNGFMTGLLNCGFSMLSGIMIFSILGNMAHVEGVGVQDVVSKGVGLAFITIPKAISHLPLPALFGGLFFLSLTIAGLSSEISINETVVASFMDKYNISRKKTATVFSIVGFLISMIFVTGSGLLILDIVDHFINNFGILFAGLTELLLLCWIFKSDLIKDHINPISEFRVGYWWKICLKYVTPIILGGMAISNLANELGIGITNVIEKVNKLAPLQKHKIQISLSEISTNYGGYSKKSIMIFGWTIVVCIIVIAYILQKHKGHESHLEGYNGDE